MLLPFLVTLFGRVFGPAAATPKIIYASDLSRQRYTIEDRGVSLYSFEQRPRNKYDMEQA
jgi:hypothetical protein